MSDWVIPGILMVVAGLVLIAVGAPLLAGKIGRNNVYGYRVRSTLRDDRVWYPVNALSGIWLIWAGLLSIVIGVLLLIFRNREEAAELVMIIGLVSLVICLAVGVYRSWKLASAIDAQLHAEDEDEEA